MVFVKSLCFEIIQKQVSISLQIKKGRCSNMINLIEPCIDKQVGHA